MHLKQLGIVATIGVYGGLLNAAEPPSGTPSPASPSPTPTPAPAPAPARAPAVPAAPAASDSNWSEPPGGASAEDSELMARARAALESGKADVSAVLCDAAYAGLHPRTEFRDLISKHAKAGPLTLCGKDEPGTRMELTLRVKGSDGNPCTNALVYIYHTSEKGWYAADGAHVRANSGDWKHARLFGYGRTDDKGELVVRTIRPAGYPNSELPAHFHVQIESGQASGGGEVRFKDDPRMTPEYFKKRGGRAPVDVETRGDGVQECGATFELV